VLDLLIDSDNVGACLPYYSFWTSQGEDT
jgi:hypothetical protein